MNNATDFFSRTGRIVRLCAIVVFAVLTTAVSAAEASTFLFSTVPVADTLASSDGSDTLRGKWRGGSPVHRIEADIRPGAIIHTNDFLNGNNPEKRTMNHAFAARLKYAFMPGEGSEAARIYKGSYQGIGLAWNEFNHQLGNPVSVYLFQGARIASITRMLSFNYEWNFGLTTGWHPYDPETNRDNRVIGSRTTAYIDADFYLAWRLSRWADINAGVSLSHFSNGNTQFPNAGLNVVGARIGLACYIGRSPLAASRQSDSRPMPTFEKRMTYDLTLFGAWKRKGMYTNDGAYAVPGTFAVMGFSFNPMYNLNHWFNAGVSLDGVYDRSANLYVEDYIVSGGSSESNLDHLRRPKPVRQMALGLSARGEFVMPYFTINVGIGANFLNSRGDFRGMYEVLGLKINVTRRAFLHIGYSVNDFKTPNHLMLGIGWRFGKPRRF